MIKIKYLTSCSGTAGSFPAGSVRELPKAKALYLIEIGRAELYIEEKSKELKTDEVPNIKPTSSRANKSKRSKKPSKN